MHLQGSGRAVFPHPCPGCVWYGLAGGWRKRRRLGKLKTWGFVAVCSVTRTREPSSAYFLLFGPDLFILRCYVTHSAASLTCLSLPSNATGVVLRTTCSHVPYVEVDRYLVWPTALLARRLVSLPLSAAVLPTRNRCRCYLGRCKYLYTRTKGTYLGPHSTLTPKNHICSSRATTPLVLHARQKLVMQQGCPARQHQPTSSSTQPRQVLAL